MDSSTTPTQPPAPPPAGKHVSRVFLHYYCFQCKVTIVMEQAIATCAKCQKPVAWLGHIATLNVPPAGKQDEIIVSK